VCGINLFLDKRTLSDESIVKKMNLATKHRGPDATQFRKYSFSQSSIYIGNNRLKIVDTSDKANQPFLSSDNRYCLSFNGEIYNYKELRNTLLNKYSFRTQSDTEVLLYYLIEYGMKGINDLNGMFAFIFYDSQTGTVQIARDAQGIKPVYYSSNENSFLVSSEIKGILASGLVPKIFNASQIGHYLKYKYAQRPETFYTNIFELEPGHFIEANTDSIQIRKWEVTDQTDIKIKQSPTFIKDIKELLCNAVEKQLRSDVANGIFLSGGVDSTLLLALTKELGIKNLPSFSVVNSAGDRNFGTEDFHYAKKAAVQYGSEYHEVFIDSEILKQSEPLFHQMDQPIGDSAILLTWLISDYSSKQIKVALSGAGADEWFAGYNRHWAYKNYLSYFYRNNSLIKLTSSLANILPDGFSHPLRKQARLLNKFTSGISSDPSETYDNFISLDFSDDFFLSLTEEYKNKNQPRGILLHQALQKDRKEYLISDILALTDKMSMIKSLEVRVPYLDKELTNYLSKLPSELLLKKGRKWILKELLNNLGGKEFTDRNKEGFGMPIGKWIKEEKNKFILEHILNKNSYVYEHIPFEMTNTLLSAHLSGKKDNSSALWSLIVLANWLQKEF
jgi:asparagine synthase (glutamine-hydrolysing)